MIIKIQNLRIQPYSQKDQLKAVFGDTLLLTFEIPHVDGESYACGLDNERFVYPPSRPLCAYTNTFIREGSSVTFSLKLNTNRFRDFVNGIRKPMPVWIQVVRTVLGKCETIVLDDILALPSVVDGANTVCEGDPLAELLDAKMDKPYVEGIEGQVLTMGADGHYAWADLPEIPEQEQADWNESDSEAKSYIRNKPVVYTKSETNALLDEKADKSTTYTKTETDGLLDAKADKATTYTKSETDTLLDAKANKATTLAGYGITDAYTKAEVDAKVASVYRYKGTVQSYSDLPSTGQEVGDVYNVETADAEHGIKAGDNVAWNGTAWDALAGEIVFPEQVQANWDESDSSEKSFIQNKPALAAVALTGSYNDLSDTPEIPEQAQANWDESDSTDASYIQNKPVIPEVEDANDYLCFTAAQASTTVKFDRASTVGTYQYIELEFSTDRQNWTDYTFDGLTGATITLANINDRVWFRSKIDFPYSYGNSGSYSKFVMSGKIYASGNIMSLLSKNFKQKMNNFAFRGLFENCASLLSAPKLSALILADSCYTGMFKGCTSLIMPPELPATVLKDFCYDSMFQGCTSLSIAPYLPATVLADYCYSGMFKGCTSLTTFPLLHPTTLKSGCYRYMFQECTGVKRIKTSQTNWDGCYLWLQNASATGVFECPSALDTTTRDASHVPAGWTIIKSDAAEDYRADWDESDSTDVSFIRNKPVIAEAEDANDYLCFTAKEAGTTVALDKTGTPDAIDLEYSTDKVNWTAYTWSDTTGAVVTLANIGDKVYFRGNNDHISKMTSAYYKFTTGTTTSSAMYYPTLTGNVMSLVDKTCRSLVIPSSYCFTRLFAGTKIGRDSKPRLPALVLKSYCYYGMFYSSGILLNEVPELPAPASGLANNCYNNMFNTISIYGDIDLRKVFPNLSGTILTDSSVTYAFNRMFYNAANHVYCHFSNGGNDNNFTEFCAGIFEGAAAWAGKISSATFVQSATGSNALRDAYIRNTVMRQSSLTATDGAISVSPCSQAYLYHNAAANVTVNATASSVTTQVMYAEFVVDVASGVTLTAGTNMTFVDTPAAGKRSICVLRWTGSSCRLYVVDEQDIPA